MKNVPSVQELYNKYSKNKIQANTAFSDEMWYSRFAGRKISIFLTWLLLHTPISPNGVTFISMLCAILGGIILAIPTLPALIISFILFQLYIILDSSDGEVARIKDQRSMLGNYLDKILHYVAYIFLFTGMGANIYFRTGNDFYIMLGLLASLLMSLAIVISYLDPLLNKMSYLETRKNDNKILFYANNAYNIITGDIEITFFLIILAPLQYLNIVNIDFFLVILLINILLSFFCGILYSVMKKLKDPRYRAVQ